mmetsp:Transcript_43557/g.134511  ORF Transcript_43557/g.134511 Transcript_43557/m.134511 type:complete len:219 (+) Transcript_43557:80-736(+)
MHARGFGTPLGHVFVPLVLSAGLDAAAVELRGRPGVDAVVRALDVDARPGELAPLQREEQREADDEDAEDDDDGDHPAWGLGRRRGRVVLRCRRRDLRRVEVDAQRGRRQCERLLSQRAGLCAAESEQDRVGVEHSEQLDRRRERQTEGLLGAFCQIAGARDGRPGAKHDRDDRREGRWVRRGRRARRSGAGWRWAGGRGSRGCGTRRSRRCRRGWGG